MTFNISGHTGEMCGRMGIEEDERTGAVSGVSRHSNRPTDSAIILPIIQLGNLAIPPIKRRGTLWGRPSLLSQITAGTLP